ncbi:hypothetical protein [Rhodospirillum rubrum]|uniref:Uncharacterized protein n=1 Tax=Rhodospirillum rubrum (strain ATCC 11170 / ATH 1.1.1 / DSM 467 / LMG 4362 / NCIMB 8255 / S1) TaxID=269796 RepID=Q2RUC4_RHORT|nr:hypothetical protein [Rhodospirillum rubrum]ABC22271.1 hypothetical protein Rru_A1470 [Rhodospirillum rubrum ATCC 11170]AEO47989.1 hypothetical protein F11_07595 [Rhodospirillum rubrum F11]MBK1663194.1 hypothetical protein [Rhodospirillum rubrum]MBK1676997.1 hypothetical protein [Rhodospirillum rubrum]MBK5953839.1 hypothetical protein [Rhodospirillum rubrum]
MPIPANDALVIEIPVTLKVSIAVQHSVPPLSARESEALAIKAAESFLRVDRGRICAFNEISRLSARSTGLVVSVVGTVCGESEAISQTLAKAV